MKTPSAGERIRADLDEALRDAGEELGRTIEFDGFERHVIDQAVAAADCAQAFRTVAGSARVSSRRLAG